MSTTHSFRIPTEIWSRVKKFAAIIELEQRTGRGRRKSPERLTCERAIELGLIFISDEEIATEATRRGTTPEVVNLAGRLLTNVRLRGDNPAAVVRAALTRGLDMMGVPG